ncbi:MAG: hypothetical protein VX642_07110, partial [Bdellovibrionota bacterium]|nr:hypothetical protein [Bdellovibrionota bacterium]
MKMFFPLKSLIAMLLSLLLLDHGAIWAMPCKNSPLTDAEIAADFVLGSQNWEAYSGGNKVGILRFLSKEEYIAEAGSMDPRSILLIDELPLDIDPPFVAGIITNKKLPLYGTHVQEMFHAMNSPLVYIQDKAYIEGLKKYEKQFVSLNIEGIKALDREGSFRLRLSSHQEYEDQLLASPKAILPIDHDRSKFFVADLEKTKQLPIELVGQKAKSLASVWWPRTKDWLPKAKVISTGAWEAVKSIEVKISQEDYPFLIGLQENIERKASIRNLILSATEYLEKNFDVTEAQEILSEVKKLIRKTDISELLVREEIQQVDINLLDYLYRQVQALQSLPDAEMAFRSSNELEDSIGAGVFESSFGKIQSQMDLEFHLKNVWSSMYSFRSYNIRRHLK